MPKFPSCSLNGVATIERTPIHRQKDIDNHILPNLGRGLISKIGDSRWLIIHLFTQSVTVWTETGAVYLLLAYKKKYKKNEMAQFVKIVKSEDDSLISPHIQDLWLERLNQANR